jgi:flavodoxin I
MTKIKVIFGSTSGNTENAANLIAAELGGEVINVTDASAAEFEADLLVLGSSTWGMGELQDDWFNGLKTLQDVDLKGKKVALFGEGDQMGFGDSYLDAVGTIYEKVTKLGAEVIGRWSIEGYEHSGSTAEVDGSFVGLALDDDNEPELTEGRVQTWCKQLKKEAGL